MPHARYNDEFDEGYDVSYQDLLDIQLATAPLDEPDEEHWSEGVW